MISWSGFLGVVIFAVLISAAGNLFLHRIWQRRFLALKQETKQFSEDLMQMAELQSDIYRQISRSLTDMEGRVLDLSMPGSGAALPLERRHQVLTLARKGTSVDEIAHRLSMPKGEVDLILNLHRFVKETPVAKRAPGTVKEYARASS
jgi:hypothetical protein